MNKFLGPNSRFGDGDGSFWDRWLTTTGYFTEDGHYSKADMPKRSMYSHGTVKFSEQCTLEPPERTPLNNDHRSISCPIRPVTRFLICSNAYSYLHNSEYSQSCSCRLVLGDGVMGVALRQTCLLAM